MESINIKTPFSRFLARDLHAGEYVLLSGEIYTARAAAHKRMFELIKDKKPLPIETDGMAIYYAAFSPTPPRKIIGAVGATPGKIMDAYAPALIAKGLRVMIGTGDRSPEVANAIKESGGCYLAAIGGAGVMYSLCVERAEVAAFADLGSEAIYKLTVRDMPLIVAIDATGKNIYHNRP